MLRRHIVSAVKKITNATGTLSELPTFANIYQTRNLAEPAASTELKKTPLHDFHINNGGKMVEFCGWSMPVQYSQSVMESSQHCREKALLFDVSHMCGLSLRGKDAAKFLEKLIVGSVNNLKVGTGTLSVFTNENGGIIDDSIVTKVSDNDLYLVVNAGRRDVDIAHIKNHLSQNSNMDVELVVHDDRGLLAIQGPAAARTLQSMVEEDLSRMAFSQFKKIEISGVPCWVTRTGYTGEDGFECSIPNEKLEYIASKFISNRDVWLGGLGARDALRLEAGLCLYGNDITETTSPVEAGLIWTIAKDRRLKCDFLGGEIIKEQLANGVSRKRIGLLTNGPPSRAHSKILNDHEEEIGEVTSGAFSPNIQKNIAMGYVKKEFSKSNTKLKVVVRNKVYDAVAAKMPFVMTSYYKPTL